MIRRPTRSARTDTLVPYTTRCRSITFNGSYNISPAISPDGNSLVYVTRRTGAFRIALQNMGSGSEQLLTAGPDDERSEEHTSELQSLMRTSYAAFCLENKTPQSHIKPN